MQKLVFTNGNGLEIDLTAGNFGITNWAGLSDTSLNIQTQQVPFEDGGVFLDALMDQREIELTVAIYDGNNLALRYQKKRELISALNPKAGEGVLVYTNDYLTRQIKAVPQLPIFENKNSNDSGTLKASVVFSCPSPYWEDVEETSVFLKAGVRTKLQNNGDVPVGVRVDFFTNNVTNPQIKSFTEKKIIKLNGTFQNEININTNLGQKNITTENLEFGISQVGTYLNAIKYIKGLDTIIIVGNKKTIISSKNGVYWEGPKSIDEGWNSRDLFDVVYVSDLELFVIVGRGVIITSADGENWSVLDINETLLSVTYGNGIIVATGSYGKIYTSADGVNWTLRTSGTNDNLQKVIYQEDVELFIAVGSGGVIFTSTDGITWTSRTSGTDKYLRSIVYANAFGKFYVVGNDGVILTSADGINWTDTESGISQSLVSITYSEETKTLVILEHQDFLYISTNGETWTRETVTDNYRYLNDVTYIDDMGVFMVVGESGLTLTSGDCIEWEGSNLEGEVSVWDDIYGLVYSKRLEMYVGCIRDAGIATSADGMKWNVKGLGRSLLSITYSESLGVFVTVGYEFNSNTSLNDGIIYTSNDAVHWTRQTVLAGKILNSVIYAEDFGFVAVGEGVIVTSSDGITWTQRSSANYSFKAVVYSKDLNLFLTTSGTTMFKSTDGVNWEETEAVGVRYFNSMIYVDTLKEFVSVGSYGVRTSTDGIVWTLQNADTNDSLYSVTYSEEVGMFIAVGNNGTMFKSSDSIDWESIKSGTSLNLMAIVSNNGGFVCGGVDGVVLKSEFTLAESLIADVSEDSNMSLGLQSGQNEIMLSRASGNLNGRISYRQKYIGV